MPVQFSHLWRYIYFLYVLVGPCPPCPVTVNAKCYCGAKPPRLQRCSDKYWSCGGSCGKLLECGKHNCEDPCHGGDCKPCTKKSIQKCNCRSKAKLRDCSSPEWQCEKVSSANMLLMNIFYLLLREFITKTLKSSVHIIINLIK